MKINKISFENFKSYLNKTVFDFTSENHINVIIGENGNGKTSFLEGIALAFFGCKMFNSDVYTNEYVSFVTSRISRGAKSNKYEICVEYTDEGKIYYLKRLFRIKNNKIDQEIFELTCEGKSVESSSFLEKYDYSIMKQVFLDGEIITKLIEESNIDSFIQNFISVAFNIRVFDQINNDIDKLNKRDFKQIQTNDHKVIENEVKKLIDEKNHLDELIKYNNSLIDNFNQQLKTIKANLDKQGVKVGGELQNLLDDNEILTAQISKLEKITNEHLLNDVHYLLHKNELSKFVDFLNSSREERLKYISEFYSTLNSNDDVTMPENYISLDVEKYFIELFKKVSDINIDTIFKQIKEINAKKTLQLKNRNVIIKTNEGKDRLDDVNEYDAIYHTVGKLKEENENLLIKQNDLIDKLDSKQNELEKITEKLISQRIDNNLTSEKIKLQTIVDKYARIKTNEYNAKIAEKSLSILKEHFLRKDNLIDKIELTGGVLSVYQDSKQVNYQNFSAGEKQMLVVSVLFAIIDVANIDIPLVLDSFVGRLDVYHTNSILEYIKNNIKTEVVLLTTDDEIDEKRLEFLNEKVGSCYRLNNDGYSTYIKEVIL